MGVKGKVSVRGESVGESKREAAKTNQTECTKQIGEARWQDFTCTFTFTLTSIFTLGGARQRIDRWCASDRGGSGLLVLRFLRFHKTAPLQQPEHLCFLIRR